LSFGGIAVSAEFHVLGPLEVQNSEGPIPLGGRKQRTLLALLLLNANELVPTTRLIEELWVERPPATALNTLQQHLSQLRKRLGVDRLLTEPGGYRLLVDERELDLARFMHLLAEGKRELASGRPQRASTYLRKALSLWRGPALAELRNEPFIESEANRLDELRLEALEERIAADLALGRHGELCSELQALVTDNPLREGLRARLMLALYRSGRQAEALETYAELRDLLNEQFGLEPGPDLRAQQRAILNHDAVLAPPAAARARLPLPAGRFIGRRSELAEAEELLQGGARLVTVTGPPGVGKTRFALELANDLAAEYADGVDFVSFTHVHDVSGICAAIAATLRLDARGEQPLLDQIAACLRERELLIVLNDFAHGRDGGALLEALLASAPRLRLLVTSREPLRLAVEHEYRLDPLPETEAMMLLAERAQEVKPDFQLTLENDAAVAEICRRLDNLPLALELAATCLRAFSPEAVLARLDDSLSLLTTREHEFRVTPGHRTLREALGRSYDGLTDPEQRVLREVSAFREGFDEADAWDACGATSEVLDALVAKSLLMRTGENGTQRFRLLEVVRAYARERLRQDEQAQLGREPARV